MSLWKWNNIELEIDMEDVEFLERYEQAFKKLEEREKKLTKTGDRISIVRDYCLLFYQVFDDIFGKGTAEKLFNGKMNARVCEECYDSFILECKKSVRDANNRRNAMVNKYKPNRAQRRAKKR